MHGSVFHGKLFIDYEKFIPYKYINRPGFYQVIISFEYYENIPVPSVY